MLDYDSLVALNEAVDTTFGRSSIRDAGHGVHCKIKNDAEGNGLLEVRFETILTFHPHQIETTKQEWDGISIKALNEELKRIKANFKEVSGKTIGLTKGNHRSNMDVISHNPSVLRAKYYNTIEYKIK